jgi:hypothetical protein
MRKEILISENPKSGGKILKYVNDFKEQLVAAFEPMDNPTYSGEPLPFPKSKRIPQTRMTVNEAVARMAAWWLQQGDYDRYNLYIDMLHKLSSRSFILTLANECEKAFTLGNAACIEGLYLEPFMCPFLPNGHHVRLRSDLEIECFLAVWDAAGKDYIEAWEDRFLVKEMSA